MVKQTLPQPKRPKKPVSRYQQRIPKGDVSQTATFEGIHDDKPIIFGLGKGLSSATKTRIQRNIFLGFVGGVVGLILITLAVGFINFNYIQPNQPIITIDGIQVPQITYRQMVAYISQDTWNAISSDNVKITNLQAQINKNPANVADLQNQLSVVQANLTSSQTAFTQTQLDQLAINHLIENQLIVHAIPAIKQSDPNAAKTLTVTSKMIDDAYKAFVSALPSGESLQSFLSKDSMSTNDLRSMITISVQRNAMDAYQQGLLVSPLKQVHIRRIQVDTLAKANTDLAALKKDINQWNTIEARDTLDNASKAAGGDMGWIIRGQQDQSLEHWVFDVSKQGDLAVVKEITGLFDIVQTLGIDPARAADASILSTLKSNALSHWLDGQRYLPTTKISATNNDMLNSTYNIPVLPSLNVTFNTSSSNPIPATP